MSPGKAFLSSIMVTNLLDSVCCRDFYLAELRLADFTLPYVRIFGAYIMIEFFTNYQLESTVVISVFLSL
jgi:hypothetical protein